MEKGTRSSLFVNDGSFMERFKQLQQDKDKEKEKEKGSTFVEESKPIKIVSGNLTPKLSMKKPTLEAQKTNLAISGGKLAFSLKQKSKLVAPPVKLGADEDEDETDAENGSADVPVKRQKLGQPDASEQSARQVGVGNYCLYMNIISINWVLVGNVDFLVFCFIRKQICWKDIQRMHLVLMD